MFHAHYPANTIWETCIHTLIKCWVLLLTLFLSWYSVAKPALYIRHDISEIEMAYFSALNYPVEVLIGFISLWGVPLYVAIFLVACAWFSEDGIFNRRLLWIFLLQWVEALRFVLMA
jgi:hypothetical protein